MSIEQFISQYCGYTEPYFFYNGSVELRYDPKEHIYYRVTADDLIPLDGVTTVCHIIDKSEVLIPWACKMMAQKLLATTPNLDSHIYLPVLEYEKIVNAAKSAHKEKLEDAGKVGHTAHNWIEQFIKAEIDKTHFDLPFPEDERAANCCRAALNWMAQHNVRWRCTERKIYSRTYDYAGTMDGLCVMDSCDNPECCPKQFKDRITVADWKTSNALHIEYLLQTAAYLYAYNEEALEATDMYDGQATDRWVIRLGKDDGEFQAWHCEERTFDKDFAAFLAALNLRRYLAAIKARVKNRESAIRAVEKEKKQAAKEEALKLKCGYADKYKGSRKPNCNGGNPCEACLKKYADTQAAKKGLNEEKDE